MADNISEAGIATGELVLATQILQLTNALRGDSAYNLHLTGGIQINDNYYPSGSASFGQTLVSDGSSRLNFGLPNAVTASYVTSSNVDGPFGLDSIVTSSYAVTASYVDSARAVSQVFNGTTIDIIHNFGTQDVLVQAYDTSGTDPVMIQPATVTILDNDSVRVTFAGVTQGYVVVSQGGYSVIGNVTTATSASYAITASHVPGLIEQIGGTYRQAFTGANSYTFTHNLGQQYVIVQCYDTSNVLVIPASVQALDANNVFVNFGTATNGNVVIKS